MSLLDPHVVLRADGGASRPALSREVRGAAEVAGQAAMFATPAAELQPVLVNGAAGALVVVAGRPVAAMGFTVVDGWIVAIEALADPERAVRVARPA